MKTTLLSASTELKLPGVAVSVAGAREFTRSCLSSAPKETIERAVLLVSELVTNAVVHAACDVRLRVTPGSPVRVEVRDENAEPPQARGREPLEVGGFGLVIVESVASRWGVEPQPTGKVVWFELDSPAR
ncbi:MAG: ATP-binding protein [Acidimicrobiia bacterium]